MILDIIFTLLRLSSDNLRAARSFILKLYSKQ